EDAAVAESGLTRDARGAGHAGVPRSAGLTVLCLVELDAGAPADASLRALTFARRLIATAGSVGATEPVPGVGPARAVGGAGGTLAALAFAETGAMPGSALAGYGVTVAYAVEPGAVAGYAPLAWARSLAGLAAQIGAGAIVAAGTDRGAEVLAHLGALTGLPLAANCVSAEQVERGTYRIVRHRWAGLLLEDAELAASPALMTVATDAVPAEPLASPADVSVRAVEPELADPDLRVCAAESAEHAAGVSLANARVVIGGGRGVGGPEGFAPLEELAGLLGGVVGVSRVVTSEGWRPHKQQVGQTGTRITPELYLACGISGAIQHMAGCAGAKHIVAINTDPGAPMLSHAEYAVIGDLREVIPALIAAIRARAAPS
ncbi:MAG TPA: electron transfer flavoprotein subunit alpha/FixB family protein, partial [Streptosporangiaceae bacterium]